MWTWYIYLFVSRNVKYLNYAYTGTPINLNTRPFKYNGIYSNEIRPIQSKNEFQKDFKSRVLKFDYELDKIKEIEKQNPEEILE